MRKVVVKTGGDSIGVRFNTQERKVYGIEEGDVVNLSNMTIEKQKEADNNISDLTAKQRQPDTVIKIQEAINDDKGFIK